MNGVERARRFSAPSEPLRVYRHPGGAWLGVQVKHTWADDRWDVYLGKGRDEGGSWQSLGVPFDNYEEACALALSMFAQLVDPFMVAESLLEAGRRRREAHARTYPLDVDTLGPTEG